jgi:transcriptional regulator with XRE-family HTH domain
MLTLLMVITAAQLRAARALLRLDDVDLADRAHVSVRTIRQIEIHQAMGIVAPADVDRIRRTLEGAGAEFIEHGVRRRQRTPGEIEARVQAILALAAESAARQAKLPPFTEDDLYDEIGL